MIHIYDDFEPSTNSERGEHLSCCEWLKEHHPDRWRWIFHCPNESNSKPQHRAMLAKMGVKPGIPDLIDLDFPRGTTGMFELKKCDKKAKASKEQVAVLEMNAASGGFSAVCYGYRQFVIAYSDYLAYCSAHGAE